MTLPTLYARTSTGATQTWEIQVSGPQYRTVSGQLDGKKVTSEWTVCEGKNQGRSNATTPEAQALAEAKARWKKKLDSGYKEDPADIDKMGFVEPMLAKNFDDYADQIAYPVFSQPKYDGIRCIATADGLKSRNGKEFVSVPHISDALKSVFDKFPGIALDGELYCDKFANDFNRICSLVKKTKPNIGDLRESRESIEYWIYDVIPEDDFVFSARTAWLQENLAGLPSCIKLVPTDIAQSAEQLDSFYMRYMDAGYEGQMVRLDTLYEHKRSKGLLKRKEFRDEEFEILDVIEGDGNKSGMAASMLFTTVNGARFNSNIEGNRDYLRGLLKERDDLIGKWATVKYFNLTPDGIPRFPYVIAIRDFE